MATRPSTPPSARAAPDTRPGRRRARTRRSHVVGPDVVRVAVAAELVVGGHDVGLVATDEPDQPADRLVEVRLPEAARVVVPGPAHHVGVAVAEVLPLGHAEVAPSPARARPPGSRRGAMVLGRVHLGDDDLALLAAGAGDEDDPVAGVDGLDHRPARPDGLVVGVGVDGHEGRPVGGRCVVGLGRSMRSSVIGDATRRDGGRVTGGGATIAAMHHRPVAPGPLAGLTVIDCSTVLAGPVLHDAARRPGRGRHQGGAAGRRRDARLGSAVGGRRGGRDADGGLLPRGQPQQAQHPARPQAAAAGAEVLRRLLAAATSSSRTSGRVASPGSGSTTRRSKR